MVCAMLASSSTLQAAKPTAEQALRLRPLQNVEYDRPSEDQIARCTIKAERIGGESGWVVRDPSGRILRRFADTNGDNRVDLWCYYHNGIEVYRDIDADYDAKADQYRWLGTAGTRWGLDRNEDGRIDAWKVISPEEVTAEVVAAMRDRDEVRFQLLLLAKPELDSLALGEEKSRELAKKISATRSSFGELVRRQKPMPDGAKWVHFGGMRPGVVPAGTDGSKRDLTVYENVVAVAQANQKHIQVQVGTLIQVGSVWRLIDVPAKLEQGHVAKTDGGFFFQSPSSSRSVPEAPAQAGLSKDVKEALARLEEIDKALAQTKTPSQRSKLNARRADVLEKLANLATTKQERNTWLRQLADQVNAAVQNGDFPEGIDRLKKLYTTLKDDPKSRELAAHVRFLWMTAEYNRALQDSKEDKDFAKIQEQWLTDLEAFVKAYPNSPDAAEAMLQLGIAHEFAGKETEAVRWYGEIATNLPDTTIGRKAAGAKARLTSVGNAISVEGRTIDGKSASLASSRGKYTLVDYWATWCEPCKQEHATLRQLQAKYGAKGFALIGVNLDSDRQDAVKYLAKNRLPWPQLFEKGGMESRLATEMGILTLPTKILVDENGKVVSRNVHVAQLEAELKKRLK